MISLRKISMVEKIIDFHISLMEFWIPIWLLFVSLTFVDSDSSIVSEIID
jgi:hypothetical protein